MGEPNLEEVFKLNFFFDRYDAAETFAFLIICSKVFNQETMEQRQAESETRRQQ